MSDGSMAMKVILSLTLMVFAGLAIADDQKKGDKPIDKKDYEKITGKWRPTSMQMGDTKFTDEQLNATTLAIDGENYTVTIKGEKDTAEIDKGTLKVDVLAKPMSMDILSKEGPNKGKTIPAIYEISGDTLKVCYALDGKKRPTEFKTGDKVLLAIYKRLKG